jgi:hypothetical protein
LARGRLGDIGEITAEDDSTLATFLRGGRPPTLGEMIHYLASTMTAPEGVASSSATAVRVGAPEVAERPVLKPRNPPSKPPIDRTKPNGASRRTGRAVHDDAVRELDAAISFKRRFVCKTATPVKNEAIVWFKNTASDELGKRGGARRHEETDASYR